MNGPDPVVPSVKLDGQCILVVDDEEEIRATIAALLASGSHSSCQVGDGAEALTKLAESEEEAYPSKQVGLILLDVMMPGLDGLTLCHMIKQKYSVPIIMVTARGSHKDVIEAVGRGADDYIIKPFSRSVLLEKVSRWLPNAVEEEKDAESAVKTLHPVS